MMKGCLIVLALTVVPVILYFPFRIVASQTNSATTCFILSDGSIIESGFTYPGALALWPIFTFLVGSFTFLGASFWQLNWKLKPLLFLATLLICYTIGNVASQLGFEDAGDTGFVSWTLSPMHLWNSTQVSVAACPITFVVGSLVGNTLGSKLSAIAAARRNKQIANS